jgi:hypothetical protein
MRLVLAPKVGVVEEDMAAAEEDKVVVEEGTAAAEEEGGATDNDQRVAEASNYRYSTYITNLSQMSLYCRYAL